MPGHQILAFVAALAVSAGAQANLLTNGSFENGSFTPPSNATMLLSPGSTLITGWTVFNDSLAWIGVGDPWGLDAQSGNLFLDLTGGTTGSPFSGVSQSIATTPGALYSVSFYLGSSNLWGRPSALTVSAGPAQATFTSPSTGTNNDWAFHTLSFTAVTPNTTISLIGAGGFSYVGLDDVVVIAVPEPEAVLLMLAGLGVLTIRARSRRT